MKKEKGTVGTWGLACWSGRCASKELLMSSVAFNLHHEAVKG